MTKKTQMDSSSFEAVFLQCRYSAQRECLLNIKQGLKVFGMRKTQLVKFKREDGLIGWCVVGTLDSGVVFTVMPNSTADINNNAYGLSYKLPGHGKLARTFFTTDTTWDSLKSFALWAKTLTVEDVQEQFPVAD